MKRFAVIGLGNFGCYAAQSLFEDSHEVIAMDIGKARVQAVAPHVTDALVLDATEMNALKTLGLEQMDAVIIATGTRIGRQARQPSQ